MISRTLDETIEWAGSMTWDQAQDAATMGIDDSVLELIAADGRERLGREAVDRIVERVLHAIRHAIVADQNAVAGMVVVSDFDPRLLGWQTFRSGTWTSATMSALALSLCAAANGRTASGMIRLQDPCQNGQPVQSRRRPSMKTDTRPPPS